MINKIKKMLGFDMRIDFSKMVEEGAIILDVRSKSEYENGHIPDSLNIPVDQLEHNLNKLKDKNKAIITCCASGMRSAAAKNILKSNGYSMVYDGGGWKGLNQKIK